MLPMFCACSVSEKKMKDHTPKPNDMYCEYNATGASNPFKVCIYCKDPNKTKCETLTKVKVNHGGNYDEYDLKPIPGGSGLCNTCTSDFYWEEE